MFLKSLTLKGFKSFADSTTLDMEPGVTVVVGPNGSGKSNVVDAISWVLGAQAPSNVRSQKMDDVIFAGTAKRAALGRAEVSLTIDNAAGLLPIDFAEVTITRTLFRDGDSEYLINGVPCRLLDIQELLSDSGVGRTQHVIVSQGQIDAVLNARPEDRRMIIEEAAGVLKFRRRREKAQRRLKATEENLTRVQDLLREVRRQLRPLERQADAARRHGDVVGELRTLQVHLAGREFDSLEGRRRAVADRRSELDRRERELRATLAGLDESVSVAESELSATGAGDIGDRLARVEGLHERAKGLRAVLSERIGSLTRELGATVDQGVVETLEAETERLRRELEEVDSTIEALAPDSRRVEAAVAQIAEQRSLFEQQYHEAPEQPSNEAARLRGELAAVSASLEANERTAADLADRLPTLAETDQRLSTDISAAAQAVTEAEAALAELARTVADAEQALADSERAVTEANDARNEAEADRRAWSARAEALAMALDDARAAAGAESVAHVDGVVGALVELVDIDPGWEHAFEAAAGAALHAVIVRDADAAHRALAAFHDGQTSGGVLALGAARGGPVTGDLRGHVRAADDSVARLVDQLIGVVDVLDDWEAGVRAAAADPTGIYVTRDGDRFAPDGWRVGMAGSGATSAALDEARQRAEAATRAVEACRDEAAAVVRRRDELRREVKALAVRRSELERDRQRHKGLQQGNESDLRALRVEAEGLRGRLAEVRDRIDVARSREAELRAALPAAEADERDARERSQQLDAARQRLDADAAQVAAERTELARRVAAVEERRGFLRARLDELDTRLENYATQRAEAAERRVHLERRLALAESLRETVTERGAVIEAEFAELRGERQAQSEAARAAASRLDQLRTQRSAAENQLGELRELATRAEIEAGEVTMRLEAAVEALRRDHDCEAHVAVATECPPLQPGTTAAARVRELERELRIMGPINPLALEEYEALQERHQFLSDQLDDVKGSRRELHKIIRAVDEEIVTVFRAAYADVAENFEKLFGALFPGGTGRLRLTAPDDPLETGIEIEAKPSGKNVKKLSLLSGGERSLTALGFLFAVFRSRPSPFYVMDEVEAALDDVNLHRFLQLVAEFRDEAQLIIVSHQKRTMEAADCLYGVTMQPGGSSRAISEKPGGVDEIDLRDREPVSVQA